MRHLNISYTEIMLMPTYERRFFINVFTEQIERQKEIAEEQPKTVITGKGERVTRVSGSAVRNYSGKI